VPRELVATLTLAAAACDVGPLLQNAWRQSWPLDPSRVTCPVRILWGTEDRLLPWPSAAARYRTSLHAEWVELEGVGHMPQLEAPLETAQLILGFTAW
jgi:pimeloyl-ACP methyl ester carboxylesterase